MRYRADTTQRAIVEPLRKAGVLVWHISRPSDLLCRRGERYYLLDCEGITKYRKRKPKQLATFAKWGVVLVKTPQEALKAVGL